MVLTCTHQTIPHGTLVEVQSGRINLFQSGRVVTDLATATELGVVGHSTNITEYCDALAL
jgi:hypothetical protein